MTAAARASADPAKPSEIDRLRSVVESYSDAYFGSDADTAYAILSPRCQTEIGRASYAQVVQQASAIYGALPIRSFSATVDGQRASVSYGYDVATLNQTDQPWQRQQGQWRYDSC